jgi:alanyl-tRNA synthetase
MQEGSSLTERLYYGDSFLREFEAQVISSEKEGERWKVVLDRTAFYPTSGGQPHDTGTLAGVPVIEVADSEQHVVHYTSAEVPSGAVRGQIDWPRRIDHMQQHTGQHLLSAAFIELFKFPTVSFHLGREISTIDLQAPEIVPRHLEEAERRTNEIIFEDRLVSVRFGTAEELAEAGIRKKVEREGILRAIEVEGFDRQPCGGTHLMRTGQAGLLLIRKVERRRDAWRVEFVCGFRALAAARGDFGTLTQAASLLSCGMPEVPRMLGKMADERREEHTALKRAEARLAEFEARAILAAQVQSGGNAVVTAVLDDATPAYLALLAAKLVTEANVTVLLASRSWSGTVGATTGGVMGNVAFAQSKGMSGDMGAVLRQVFREFGGKGGGGKDFAQGTLTDANQADSFLARAQALVTLA